MKTGIETSLSEYCPIDLFSGEEHLVQDAIGSLVKTPQNNLRLFVDGTQRTITSESIAQSLSGPSNQDFQRTNSLTGDKKSPQTPQPSQKPLLTDVLTQILVKSPLLRRLGRLQQAMDSLDIETIHRFYVQLADPATIILPEPTLDECVDTAEAFLNRTEMDAMMNKDQVIFEGHNVASLGFGPDDALDEIPDSLKLHFIREFILSATLKDCSILITIRRCDKADELNKGNTNKDLSKVARYCHCLVSVSGRVCVLYHICVSQLDTNNSSIVNDIEYMRTQRRLSSCSTKSVIGSRSIMSTFATRLPVLILVPKR